MKRILIGFVALFSLLSVQSDELVNAPDTTTIPPPTLDVHELSSLMNDAFVEAEKIIRSSELSDAEKVESLQKLNSYKNEFAAKQQEIVENIQKVEQRVDEKLQDVLSEKTKQMEEIGKKVNEKIEEFGELANKAEDKVDAEVNKKINELNDTLTKVRLECEQKEAQINAKLKSFQDKAESLTEEAEVKLISDIIELQNEYEKSINALDKFCENVKDVGGEFGQKARDLAKGIKQFYLDKEDCVVDVLTNTHDLRMKYDPRYKRREDAADKTVIFLEQHKLLNEAIYKVSQIQSVIPVGMLLKCAGVGVELTGVGIVPGIAIFALGTYIDMKQSEFAAYGEAIHDNKSPEEVRDATTRGKIRGVLLSVSTAGIAKVFTKLFPVVKGAGKIINGKWESKLLNQLKKLLDVKADLEKLYSGRLDILEKIAKWQAQNKSALKSMAAIDDINGLYVKKYGKYTAKPFKYSKKQMELAQQWKVMQQELSTINKQIQAKKEIIKELEEVIRGLDKWIGELNTSMGEDVVQYVLGTIFNFAPELFNGKMPASLEDIIPLFDSLNDEERMMVIISILDQIEGLLQNNSDVSLEDWLINQSGIDDTTESQDEKETADENATNQDDNGNGKIDWNKILQEYFPDPDNPNPSPEPPTPNPSNPNADPSNPNTSPNPTGPNAPSADQPGGEQGPGSNAGGTKVDPLSPMYDPWGEVFDSMPDEVGEVCEKVLSAAEGYAGKQLDKLIAKYPGLQNVLNHLGIDGTGVVRGVVNIIGVLVTSPDLGTALGRLTDMALNSLKQIAVRLIQWGVQWLAQKLLGNMLMPQVVKWVENAVSGWAVGMATPVIDTGLQALRSQIEKCAKRAGLKINPSAPTQTTTKFVEELISNGKKNQQSGCSVFGK